MIKKNEPDKPVEAELVDADESELDPEDFFKAFWLLLQSRGGFMVVDNAKFHSKEVMPEGATINPQYDHKTKTIAFVAEPRPKKNLILRPRQKKFRGPIIAN